MKKIVAFLPLLVVTSISFIIMIKVLLGQIGVLETWRVYSSITAFMVFLLLDFFFLYFYVKKYGIREKKK